MKTALVIASWAGPRRVGQQEQWEYLRAWREVLMKYRHSVSIVILVVNQHYEENDAYREELMAFKPPVVIFRRHNVSGSYGAWWEALRLLPGFDWYFIFEDDYVPVQDDWDQKLLAYDAPDIGYVGGVMGAISYGLHLGAANGAIKAEAFAKCDFEDYGGPVYDDHLQIGWSQMFIRAGYRIVDHSDKYLVPFWSGAMHSFGKLDAPPLIVPFQYYRTQM